MLAVQHCGRRSKEEWALSARAAAGVVVVLATMFGATSCARRVVPEAAPTASPDASGAAAPAAASETDDMSSQASKETVPKPPAAPVLFPTRIPDGKKFVLAWTGAVEGYVAPCGCTGDPLGGVSRLSAALDQARAAYGDRVLFLDAGNLFFETDAEPLPADACQTDARVELLLSTYARQGLKATTLGRNDDVRGAAWRDGQLAAANVPTVLTAGEVRNPANNAAAFSPSLVQSVAGINVGVVAFRLARASNAEAVEKAVAALNTEVATLRTTKGVDVVVALAQAPRPITKRVLAKTLGIDVALLGEEPGELPSSPERIGQVLLMSSGQQAQFLGLAEFVLDELKANEKIALDDRQGQRERRLRLLDERIEQYAKQVAESEEGPRKDFIAARLEKAKNEKETLASGDVGAPPKGASVAVRSVPLPRGFPEEATSQKALDAYEAAIPTLTAKCEANIVCPTAPAGAATYVGVETCFQCHRGAVQFWQQQKVEGKGKDKEGNPIVRTLSHATAWETLVDEGKDTDRTCVGCHSIGFNAPGGYCKTSEVDFRTNVQCEACHGPASKHVAEGDPAFISKTVDESTCRGCHHVPHIESSSSFVYDDKLLLILGEGHGIDRRKEVVAKKAASK